MREDDIPTTAAPPEFAFAQARVAVAQICQSAGYDGAQRPALDALADVATRYLKSIAKSSAESANSSGRTESNLFDVIAAVEELRSVEGFGGSWRVRSRCLWRSAAIKDLMRFFKYTNRIPFAQPLPPRTSCPRRERLSVDRDNSGWYGEGRTKHVPRWLPAAEERTEEPKGSESAEERTGEVKWECGKREDADLGEIEMEKMKRGSDNEMEQVLYSKRARASSQKRKDEDEDEDDDEDMKELGKK